VNKARDAPERFKEATAAYEVLSDPQKRTAYDRFGEGGAPFGFGAGPQRGRTYTWTYRPGQQQPFGGASDFEDPFAASPFSGMSLEELLGALGGGGRRGRRGRPGSQQVGGDLEYPLTLDFMQAVKGTTTALELHHEDGATERIQARIPAGVHEGSKVRLRGKGGVGPGGRGDLYILTHVREHPYFRREGNDILLDLPVSIAEAALGTQVTVPTLDGPARLKVPPGTSSGTRLRLRGRGAPDPKTGLRGDQYAVIKIVLPRSLSEKGRRLLEELASAEPYNPRGKVLW
jgi:curved DNA-binding protein